MPNLEVRIPPPIVALVTAMLMWMAAWMTPALSFAWRGQCVLGGCFAVIGVVTAVSGVVAFRRARTTVNPVHPERASSLVIVGVYRITRNPMYLGLLAVLIGWAVYLSNVTAMIFLPLFVLYINRFQIAPEERALDAKFGASFTEYKKNVRRWI